MNIAQRRLLSQHIGGSELKTPAAVVSHMGAMQAQDFNMVKWAIGVRLPGISVQKIEESFNSGEVIRTHLMRPTWHLVVPEDLSWLIELTAPRIKAAAQSRHTQLGIDDNLVAKSKSVIEKALQGNRHMTREELMIELEMSGIKARNERLSHLMFCAELDGIVCSGEIRNKQHTYALDIVELTLFQPVNKKEIRGIEKAAERYEKFLGKQIRQYGKTCQTEGRQAQEITTV